MNRPFSSHRPARTWQQVTLTVAPELTDVAAGFLADLTGQGVETRSMQNEAADIPMVRVIGYFPQDENDQNLADQMARIKAFLASLAENFPDRPAAAMQVDTIQEEDWGRSWKDHFKPLSITPRLVIKPTWESYESVGDEAVIEMDPGLAFGTGHHASTHQALNLIDAIFAAHPLPLRALDVGTGTGILAMGCALFGSREVLAIDNDPDAVAAAKANVAANRLEKIITVSDDDLAAVNGSFDLICANITQDVLQQLAPDLLRHLAAGGRLVLAGILRDGQEDAIVRQYTGLGLALARTTYEEEWVALMFLQAGL